MNEILTKKAAHIIYEQIDPWVFQSPEKTKDEIFGEIVDDIRNGRSIPLEKDGFILYVVPETKWLARIHMFSKAENHMKALNAFNFLTNLIFDSSKVQKLYGINHFKSVIRISKKIGWTYEGTITKSFMTKEGNLIDQYIFGVTREENQLWRNKND